MSKMDRFLRSIALVTTFVTLGYIPASGQIVSVTVPTLPLAKDERIIGFEFHVNSGRIARLPNIPIGWNISVDNDLSWRTAIEDSIEVGAAAKDLEFLRDFMIVEKEPSPSPDVPFELYGEVVVTSGFKSERHIRLTGNEFVMKSNSTRGTSKR